MWIKWLGTGISTKNKTKETNGFILPGLILYTYAYVFICTDVHMLALAK